MELNKRQKADFPPISNEHEYAREPNTDAGIFYEVESRKNVLLIHTLSSIYCVLSKHCLPFVLALNLTTRQAIPMYFPVIKK